MMGLVRQTLRPMLPRQESVENWPSISWLLREPSGKRELQIEKIMANGIFLS